MLVLPRILAAVCSAPLWKSSLQLPGSEARRAVELPSKLERRGEPFPRISRIRPHTERLAEDGRRRIRLSCLQVQPTQIHIRGRILRVNGNRGGKGLTGRGQIAEAGSRGANQIAGPGVIGIQGDRRLPFPGRAKEIAAHERDNGGVMARVGAGRIEAAKAGERFREPVDVARIRQNRCDLLVCAGIQGGAPDSRVSSAEGAFRVTRRCQQLGELDQGRR